MQRQPEGLLRSSHPLKSA